ncbi:hypothetical protein EV122DRAFT_201431 [Schizophyllum commune]
MSPTAHSLTSTPNSGQSPAQARCTPRCALVIDPHLRGRTSRSVALGDIRKTQTSLMAPFHTIIDAASQRSKENRRPQPPSTMGSRSSVASSISPSARSALTSRVSTSEGGKVRPCVVIGMNGTNARVCLMGTFEGLFIDRLPAEVQQRVAVMYSPTCKHKGGWLQRPNIAHMHSIPDWHHDEGKVQYIVSLVHDIGLHDVGKRWVVKTPTARPGEGYYMDMDNSSELRTSAGELSADLQRRCGDRKYRTHMRQVLKEFKRSVTSASSHDSQRLVGGKSGCAQRDFGVGNFLFGNRDHRIGRSKSNRLVLVAQWNVRRRYTEVSRALVHTRLARYGDSREAGSRGVVDTIGTLTSIPSSFFLGELLLFHTHYLPY